MKPNTSVIKEYLSYGWNRHYIAEQDCAGSKCERCNGELIYHGFRDPETKQIASVSKCAECKHEEDY